MSVDPRDLARYRRHALRTTETFQGGIYPFPMFVPGPGGEPVGAHGVAWRSVRTNLLWTEVETQAGTAGAELALEGLLQFLKKYQRELMGRPARFELTDPALADAFRTALADPEAEVVVVPSLPEVEEALRDVSRTVDDEDGSTRLVDAPGVPPDQLQAFAAAAAACYQAAPWTALAAIDLIRVEAPDVPDDLRVVSLTADPAGLLLFATTDDALDFLEDADEEEQIDPWSIAFGPIEELSFADAGAWHARGLAVAGPRAYPRVFGPGEEATVPTPDEIAGLTVVLGALARSREADFDAGEWSCRVDTADGPVDVRLSLPGLLTPPDPDMPDPGADLDVWGSVQEEKEKLGVTGGVPADAPAAARAQVLALEAMAATGRRQLRLAREALALDPACADALRVLAIRTHDLDAALPLYRQALAAAERSRAGMPEVTPSWDAVGTRPYVRARLALGNALDAKGLFDEAKAQFEAVLDPDPQAPAIARDLLLETLFRAGAKDEALALVERFAADPRAVWRYAWALVAYWREGDSAESRARLAEAFAANPHAAPYLAGSRDLDEPYGPIDPGSPEEGADIADRLVDLWDLVPGAADWLKAHAPAPRKRRR